MKIEKISADAVPAALERADHYRLLNEPDQAESIYLDVLLADAGNQRALQGLVLSLTDQFASSSGALRRARKHVKQLTDEYKRTYYSALIAERHGRAQLEKHMSSSFAHDSFIEAIDLYKQAEALRPPGNDETILRRNSCIRTIERHGLEPRGDHGEPPLE